MSTQFDCRLLVSREYETAVRDLERVAGGDDSALRSIQTRCREELVRGTFARWHASAIGLYLQKRWPEIVNGLPSRAGVEAAESIAEVFIALACMPEFQAAYEYGTKVSPNLVVLLNPTVDSTVCSVMPIGGSASSSSSVFPDRR